MADLSSLDSLLVQWGDREFYPGNRIVKVDASPRLIGHLMQQRASAIRARIEGTVLRRAPQVMVKVTGGGRGMQAIAAHFKYISKNGRLDIEDDRGEVFRGRESLRWIADDWRLGGTPIDDAGYRREAFNIMLSMPYGVDPLSVLKSAKEFAAEELCGHKYLMVLHDHQANPHVHLSVRAESRHGNRLNPRKADLQRWRATFAQKLRGWGIEAEASSRSLRGQGRESQPLWKIKARGEVRLVHDGPTRATPRRMPASVRSGWSRLVAALDHSAGEENRQLAAAIEQFVREQSIGHPPQIDRVRSARDPATDRQLKN